MTRQQYTPEFKCRAVALLLESDTLKTDLMRGNAFVSREQAMNALFDYIEVFYNRRRKHSTLGYQTPVDYEMAA